MTSRMIINRINAICEETGLALSVVVEKLLLYALDHSTLAKVVKMDLVFKESEGDT